MKAPGAKVYFLDSIKSSQVPRCVFCHTKNNLHHFRKQTLCTECLRNIRKLYSVGYFNKEKLTIC